MLLDSTFLIDLLRRTDQKALRKAEELDQLSDLKIISSISVLELWRGSLRLVHQEREKQKIDELLQTLVVYPVDELVAKKAAEIEADLLGQGTMIDLEDIMIAAIAMVNGEKLVTRDNHYTRIDGLKVIKY